jgi:hypothetical protein
MNLPSRYRFRIGGGIALLALALATLRAQGPAVSPSAPSPLSPLAFLVGGSWRANLPDTPGGQTVVIETRYTWSANHRGVRFDSTWFVAGRPHPYASGMYAWSPAQKRLVLWYTNADGSLAQGSVEIGAGKLQYDLTVTNPSGSAEPVRAEIVPIDARTYSNTIFVQKAGEWSKLIEVRNTRSAPPDSAAAP